MYILSIDGVDGVKPNIIVEANPTKHYAVYRP